MGSVTFKTMQQSVEVPRACEATVRLRELEHRVGNEVAAAEAAVRLARNAIAEGRRTHLLDMALDRLTAFGAVHRVLSSRSEDREDVSEGLHVLCRGLVAGRIGLEDTRITVTAPPTYLDGEIAHRLRLVAAELVFNSVRHALTGREGHLHVDLAEVAGGIVLSVEDDGPGMTADAATRGTGLGSDIVRSLVEAMGAYMDVEAADPGTIVRVIVPTAERARVH